MTTDTYYAILQASKELFIRQGYTATSMRQIAERTGIGKATIYHHFQDKSAILNTLVNSNVQQMNETLAIIRSEEEPNRRIETTAKIALNFLFESASLLQIARRELPGVRDSMLSNYLALFHQYVSLLVEAFNKGMKTGIFRPIDPYDTAIVFMTMIQGSFAMVYLSGERPDTPDKVAARLLEVFFNGINASTDK